MTTYLTTFANEDDDVTHCDANRYPRLERDRQGGRTALARDRR
jgi:hypothetical protein